MNWSEIEKLRRKEHFIIVCQIREATKMTVIVDENQDIMCFDKAIKNDTHLKLTEIQDLLKDALGGVHNDR